MFSDVKGDKTIICQSNDAIKPSAGTNIQAGECDTCPSNQFGTGKEGKGKACKNQIKTAWVIPGQLLPCVCMLPPTSLRNFSKYITDLSSGVAVGDKSMPVHYCQAVAINTLDQQEEGGNVWSELVTKFDKLVDSEKMLNRLAALREKFMERFAENLKDETEKNLDEAPMTEAVVVDDFPEQPPIAEAPPAPEEAPPPPEEVAPPAAKKGKKAGVDFFPKPMTKEEATVAATARRKAKTAAKAAEKAAEAAAIEKAQNEAAAASTPAGPAPAVDDDDVDCPF